MAKRHLIALAHSIQNSLTFYRAPPQKRRFRGEPQRKTGTSPRKWGFGGETGQETGTCPQKRGFCGETKRKTGTPPRKQGFGGEYTEGKDFADVGGFANFVLA